MPRGGGRRSGGGGGGGGGASRQYSSKPPSRDPSPRGSSPNQAPKGGGGGGGWGSGRSGGGGGGGGGVGLFGTIAGSFFGSALGNIVGHGIASAMFKGRDPDTGEYTDRKLAEDNPCKKELDYFIECAKYVEDPSFCKGPSEALKKCAERHKDYFEAAEEE